MAMFDSKIFNAHAFGKYMERVPNTNKDELIKSGVMVGNAEIRSAFTTNNQTGTFFLELPFFGLLDGEEDNFDGNTDISVGSTDSYSQGVVTFGRAKAWGEKDFSSVISGGVNFMSNVAEQVVKYWDTRLNKTLICMTNGWFSMPGDEEKKFIEAHTHDVTGEGDGKVAETTLNTALQKASGDHKSAFKLVLMHSTVATTLENKKLLKFLTQTDKNGIEVPLQLAHWNGRLVIIDDSLPTEQVPAQGKEGEEGYVPGYTKYTTFVFGEGAIRYEDLPVDHAIEMTRDSLKHGGKDILISRVRKCIAPYGISFTNKSVANYSPTNAEFEKGENWALVNNKQEGENRKVWDHKTIAIARIFSRG